MKKHPPIWEQLHLISLMRQHELVIERIAEEALAEARKSVNSWRRSLGQKARRRRENRASESK
jgi:hypothetical protein